jgi:hypothetical protein
MARQGWEKCAPSFIIPASDATRRTIDVGLPAPPLNEAHLSGHLPLLRRGLDGFNNRRSRAVVTMLR